MGQVHVAQFCCSADSQSVFVVKDSISGCLFHELKMGIKTSQSNACCAAMSLGTVNLIGQLVFSFYVNGTDRHFELKGLYNL